MTQDNRSVTDSATDRPPISTDPSVHRSHGRTDGLTKNYSPLDSVSPNAPRTKTDNEFDTVDGSTNRLFPAWLTESLAQQAEDGADKADRIFGPGTGDEARQLAADLRNPPKSTTETIDQVRPVVDSVARIEDLRRATMRALVAEVRRLRDQVAELEALRRADITVIGHLGVAVPRAEAERDAALARVAAARRALLQGGQLAEIRCRAALVALDEGRG